MTFKRSDESLDQTFWTQATWFVDPQNVTGLARDDNSGIDAAHPVLSYNGGIVAKWGTRIPTLAQDTTITWLSDANPGDGDSVIITPVMAQAVLTLQGVVNASRIVHSGVLAGVVPKVIAASPGESLLAANIGYVEATPEYTVIRNTTVGKVSNAWLDLNLVGSNWSLSQPLIDGANPFLGASAAAQINTWANGDTFEAIHYCKVNIVVLQPTIAGYISPTFQSQVQIRNINVIGAGGEGVDDMYLGDDINFIECSSDACVITRANEDAQATWFYNFNATQGLFDASGSNYFTTWQGGRIISAFGTVVSFALSHDVICDANIAFPNFIWGQSFRPTNPFFSPQGGSVYIRGIVTAFSILRFDPAPSTDGHARVWGPGTLDTQGFARVSYTQVGGNPAQQTFLCAGLTLNGLANVTGYDPTTGLWTVLIPLTAVNLDTPILGGGFGGLAVNVGGSSMTNKGLI